MSTYSKIYIHVVFVVNGRQSLIHPQWEEKLYKYITGIVQNKQQIMVAINGMPDHIHFLIAMKPTCCLSDLVREIKKSTNEMINAESLTSNKFKWQEGYGAFSYTHYSLDTIINYIANQKEHHAKKKFKEEFIDLLKNHQVPYEEKYLFEWID
jgi:putative transposase